MGTTSRVSMSDAESDGRNVFVEYGIEDRPPLSESVVPGLQHYSSV